MATLPHQNARLTAVTGVTPARDGWDTNPAAAESVWSGNAPAFVSDPETREESAQGSGHDVVTSRKVYVPAVAEIAVGQQITVRYDGSQPTWRVAGVAKRGVGSGSQPLYELTIEVS